MTLYYFDSNLDYEIDFETDVKYLHDELLVLQTLVRFAQTNNNPGVYLNHMENVLNALVDLAGEFCNDLCFLPVSSGAFEALLPEKHSSSLRSVG